MREQKKKRHLYVKFLVAFALVNMLVVLVITQVVYSRLLVYEAGMPNTALREFFEEITSGNLDNVRRDSGFEDKTPEEREAFDRNLSELYVGRDPKELSYRRVASSDPDGRIVYAVYFEGEKLGEIYMYSTGGTVSGSISSVDDFLESTQGEQVSWKFVVPVEIATPPTPPARNTEPHIITIRTPDSVTVYVDGEALSPEEAIEVEREDTDIFSNLPAGYSAAMPGTLTFEVECSTDEPVVTARDMSGAEKQIDYDAEKQHYEVVAMHQVISITPEEREDFTNRVTNVARAYALFISRDGTHYTLSQYLYPGTDFAARMAGFDNQWYGAHSNYEFANLEVRDVAKFADDVYVGHIVFDFVVDFYSGQRTFPSDYTMIFVNSGGQWLLADLRVA